MTKLSGRGAYATARFRRTYLPGVPSIKNTKRLRNTCLYHDGAVGGVVVGLDLSNA